MSAVKVFVSFEFGKDNYLKDSFYKQGAGIKSWLLR